MGLNAVNFSRSIAALGRRLRLMVDRALVRIVTDSLGRQNLQVQSLADETNDDVERFQNYGFSSVRLQAPRRLLLLSVAVAAAWWPSLSRIKGVAPVVVMKATLLFIIRKAILFA
ncbi:Mu-like prophage protein gp45 [Klebsiella pneumoniae]|uniref:Mu-like prophage protein gp45 n=1 Tax=Klebsiella pneumoniae TaxID=573 RepID=A0A378C7J1_KLEPN|nr:Mu-like prophage protein gp45 [Klebsiella pneumoniae]